MTTGIAQQFDMFSEQAARGLMVTRGSSKSAKPDKPAIPMSEEDMVRHLSETGRYRILQKLMPRAVPPFPRPEYPLKGIILDTETTGLNARKDEIIEIGVNGGAKSGQCGGVKPGQRQVCGADMEMAPIGAISMSGAAFSIRA